MPYDWTHRVGGDIWKNVIRLETQAMARLARPRLILERDRLEFWEEDRVTRAFGYETFPGGDGAEPSHIVFQAGRLFVVRPTQEVFDQALEIKRQLSLKRLHLVLLEFPGGSRPFPPEALADPEAVVVWTSYLVWDETHRALNPKPGPIHLMDQENYAKQLPNAEKRLPVVAFEKEMTMEFSPGVGLALRYTPHSAPCLSVDFRCNNEWVTVDSAFGLFDLKDFEGRNLRARQAGSVGKSVLDDSTLKEIDLKLRGLRLANSKNFSRYPDEFRAAILSRQNEVTARLLEIHLRVDNASEVRQHGDLLFVRMPGLDEPADLQSVRRGVPYLPAPAPAPAMDHKPQATTPALRDTVVLLLCGGLMEQPKRELIDPGYELDIRLEDEDGKLERMSIVEWRLHQLGAWYAGVESADAPPLEVLLLTTPDTERIVLKSAAAFANRRQEPSRLSVRLRATQLVPVYEQSEEANLLTEADGGWRLYPRGHMDCLRLLLADKSPAVAGKRMAMVVGHNNLGLLFDSDAVECLRRMAKSGAHLGVELFGMEKPQDTADTRWPQLSFCRDLERVQLAKDWYFQEAAPEDQRQRRFYSSLTWYVNLENLAALEGLRDQIEGLSCIFRPQPSGEGVSPRQDLDQATHLPNLSVKGFDFSGAADQSISNPLYANARYLGVRTHDHIRHAEFAKQFQMVGAVKGSFRRPSIDASVPFFTISPRLKEYVWGGHEIALRKGLAEATRGKIAESWEVSTHELGRASVFVDATDVVPLLDLIRALTGDELKLDYMAKYLDCHQALSLQVHPTPATGRVLKDLSSGRDFREPIRDDNGKEESFLVLSRTPGQIVHLFLGFQRSRLKKLAAAIRPRLERLSDPSLSGTVQLDYELGQICESLGNMLEWDSASHIEAILFEGIASDPVVWDKVLGPLTKRGEDHAAANREIIEAMKHHLRQPLGASRLVQASDPALLLGMEYVFCGIAVISLIRELDTYVKDAKSRHGDVFVKNAQRLFGLDFAVEPPSVEQLGDKKAYPLLSFFHGHSVNSNALVRVPPGTVHAWQGGRNLLIELSHASDNTFRILDFGREASSHRREMHHRSAMYALNKFSFLDEGAARKLVSPLPSWSRERGGAVSDWAPSHDRLRVRLLCGEPRYDTDDGLRFLMNPDGDLQILAEREGSTHYAHIGRCRTVLLNGQARVLPQQEDDRVLLIEERQAQPPFVCLCLGGNRWQAAMWRDQHFPRVKWRNLEEGHDAGAVEKALAAVNEYLSEELEGTPAGQACVGVSWPGYREHREAARPLFYCSLPSMSCLSSGEQQLKIEQDIQNLGAQKVYLLSDFQAGVLGEIRHPLGRLSPDQPATLINCDRGICVGFYHPQLKVPKMFDDNRLTICSAVGRWLYWRPKEDGGDEFITCEELGGDDSLRVEDAVFSDRPANCVRDALRASKYFSAAGLVARAEHPSTKSAGEIARTVKNKEGLESVDLYKGLREITSGRFKPVLKIFVASPGDVNAERELVSTVVGRLNQENVDWPKLEVVKWETHASPGFDAGGIQDRIDSLMPVTDCDVVIGIFWKKLGQGAHHELEKALAEWRKNDKKRPHIMVYFNVEVDFGSVRSQDLDNLRPVIEFREELEKFGLISRYRGVADLEGRLAVHLRDHLNRIPESPNPRSFIRNFGANLGRLIERLSEMLSKQAKTRSEEPQSDERLSLHEFTAIRKDCLKNIVLTGHVGQYFGLPERIGETDELVYAMKDYLQKTLGEVDLNVWRSEIGVAAEREIEGFLDYRERTS